MVKKTILDGRNIKNIEVEFNDYIRELKEWLKDNRFGMVGVETLCSMDNRGVSMTLNNKIIGDMSDILEFNEKANSYVLRLKGFANAIAFNENANILFDTGLRRIYFKDFNLKLQFYKI
ncbi:MAG: hypothetical protein E7I48_09345 [Clostridium celatum]|jgi:formylmethanofuran dehydrogenase subunit B|nr:hypothetical protein [Clostridium celatum]